MYPYRGSYHNSDRYTYERKTKRNMGLKTKHIRIIFNVLYP